MVWIQTLIDTSYGKSWPASSVGGNFHGDKYPKKKKRISQFEENEHRKNLLIVLPQHQLEGHQPYPLQEHQNLQ